MLSLRPYQRRAIDSIQTAYREGTVRPLTVHPTGTGKTVTFSHLIAERADEGRSLVLVHREELAGQTADKIAMIAPELNTGIVKAERNDVHADAVIASVQTVQHDARLAQVLAAGRFATVIVDEAHHAPAPSWRKVLEGLGSFSPYGPLTAGFTATPQRDGRALDVWEKVVSYMSMREAIYGDGRGDEGGYLVPIEAETIKTGMDLQRVRKTGGDYQEGGLGKELEESGALDEIADAYVRYAADRKGVAFTPTVATAHKLAEALRARGIAAEALDGETEKGLRAAILKRLKTGETQVVVNCGVLTEGFDEPSISCVVVARPTKFQGLYVQMVGRGTRLYPGKTNLLVLDVVGATERHDLITYVDLGLAEEGKKRKPEGESEPRLCPVCGVAAVQCEVPEHRCRLCTRVLPAALIKEGQRTHDTCAAGTAGRKTNVFEASRLAWLPVGDGWCLSTGKAVVIMAPLGGDSWKLASYENTKLTILHEELPADWAMGIGEDRAKAFQKLAERDARWRNCRPSDRQKRRLVLDGFKEDKLHLIRTQGDAADLITRIQARHGMRKLLQG